MTAEIKTGEKMIVFMVNGKSQRGYLASNHIFAG